MRAGWPSCNFRRIRGRHETEHVDLVVDIDDVGHDRANGERLPGDNLQPPEPTRPGHGQCVQLNLLIDGGRFLVGRFELAIGCPHARLRRLLRHIGLFQFDGRDQAQTAPIRASRCFLSSLRRLTSRAACLTANSAASFSATATDLAANSFSRLAASAAVSSCASTAPLGTDCPSTIVCPFAVGRICTTRPSTGDVTRAA